MNPDLEIARAAKLRPIQEIATKLGIPEDAVEPYGRHKAKIGLDFIDTLESRPDGALVLVTGINPTPAGEGKNTTTTVGLGDALNRIGKRAAICLREPSLGPSFGMKGGAAGGGYAQVVPMDQINLHFTGDFHAITSANNLLAAMIDNSIYWGNPLGIDARRISWRRCLDMNDRALRAITGSLGGVANGFPREDGFDITVASEVMAVFCLSRGLPELQARLGKMIIGQTRDGKNITAADLKADGAMSVLLKDAVAPNLVQTLEGSPALVHGGPFANIAHGCNSVMATRLGLKLADVVVTEAGFGADLGGEKFLDIKCRSAGLKPSCAVVVATVRALKMHGGIARNALGPENVDAVKRGIANLQRHVENLQKFGLPVVVAVNHFTSDTEAEFAAIKDAMATIGTEAISCTHWAHGGAGAEALAHAVVSRIESGKAAYKPLYPLDMKLADKVRTIAREIYRADDIAVPDAIAKKLKTFEDAGFGDVPVCIAKTQYSFTSDATVMGAPTGHILPVREVRLSAGAGFVVAICGDIMTMPGLPRVPAAESIYLREDGEIEGLFDTLGEATHERTRQPPHDHGRWANQQSVVSSRAAGRLHDRSTHSQRQLAGLRSAGTLRTRTRAVQPTAEPEDTMAKFYEHIEPAHAAFIAQQHIFFTASAASTGRVNVSPRGADAFRVIDPNTVAYLDETGSGNETAAHLRAAGRLTIMFCGFESVPMILRLYGQGRSIPRDTQEYAGLLQSSFNNHQPPGARQIILLSVDLVQTSCGYGVPLFDYKEDRPTLRHWAEAKGNEGILAYRRQKNVLSLDGFETGVAPEAPASKDPAPHEPIAVAPAVAN